MQKKKTFWLPLILSVLLTLIAAACGPTKSTGTTTTPSAPPTVPAGESFYILDGYGVYPTNGIPLVNALSGQTQQLAQSPVQTP